jgi:hypothetical protein
MDFVASPPLGRFAAALALILPLLVVTSRGQDLPPPPNAAEILRELDKVSQGSKFKAQNRRNAAISQIQAAANSPTAAVDLYLRALENTKYLENHQDYVDWNRKNQELLHSISFQAAAQLQMRYLAMALARDEKHDAYSQIPECLSYLETLAAQKSLRKAPQGAESDDDSAGNSSTARAQGKIIKTTSTDKPYPEALALIGQPLDKSSVVEWLQISDLLPENDFEPSAGKYQSIMEKNVRGPLKVRKDPRIIQTWDLQIARETAAATESNSKQVTDDFNRNRAPDLLFSKAQDTAEIGQPNRALAEIMLLVRNYPENPSVTDWITMARNLLTNPPLGPGATAVTPQTPAATNLVTNPVTPPAPANSPSPTNSPATISH